MSPKTITVQVGEQRKVQLSEYQSLSLDDRVCVINFDYSVKYLGPLEKAPASITFDKSIWTFRIYPEYGADIEEHYYEVTVENKKEKLEFNPRVKIKIIEGIYPYLAAYPDEMDFTVFAIEDRPVPEIRNRGEFDVVIQPQIDMPEWLYWSQRESRFAINSVKLIEYRGDKVKNGMLYDSVVPMEMVIEKKFFTGEYFGTLPNHLDTEDYVKEFKIPV